MKDIDPPRFSSGKREEETFRLRKSRNSVWKSTPGKNENPYSRSVISYFLCILLFILTIVVFTRILPEIKVIVALASVLLNAVTLRWVDALRDFFSYRRYSKTVNNPTYKGYSLYMAKKIKEQSIKGTERRTGTKTVQKI